MHVNPMVSRDSILWIRGEAAPGLKAEVGLSVASNLEVKLCLRRKLKPEETRKAVVMSTPQQWKTIGPI